MSYDVPSLYGSEHRTDCFLKVRCGACGLQKHQRRSCHSCQTHVISVPLLEWVNAQRSHWQDGTRRTAACIGGMLSVMNGTCRLLATTWEWKEDIDAERAQAAKKRAEEMIAKGGLTDQEYKMASAKLQRALVRLSVKE